MFQLHKLRPSGKKRKRIGRGGSRGGTSGKGHKGQKARSGGKVRRGFEGGQMPLVRRLPKRGFNNVRFETEYKIVNLEEIEHAFAPEEAVNLESLLEKGLIRKKKGEKAVRIKILGRGELTKKLVFEVDAISDSAKQLIEKQGGQVVLKKEG